MEFKATQRLKLQRILLVIKTRLICNAKLNELAIFQSI